ncbi:MAG: ribonuclease J, partial [Eubacterium sp.]|nr:ribonuclease J [Eubacterium sp.]
SRGFVFVREAENLIDECREIVNIALDRLSARGITDWNKMKNEIKDSLTDFLWKKMKRNPVILPIITEV